MSELCEAFNVDDMQRHCQVSEFRGSLQGFPGLPCLSEAAHDLDNRDVTGQFNKLFDETANTLYRAQEEVVNRCAAAAGCMWQ